MFIFLCYDTTVAGKKRKKAGREGRPAFGGTDMELKRTGKVPVLQQNRQDGIEYLTFPALEEGQVAQHRISTRLGGVSRGIFATMNYSYDRGDEKAAVDENYRRTAALFGKGPDAFVCSAQTHTTHVRVVTRSDAGKGVTRPLDYTDVDGLITDVPGLILRTSFADCVPLLFLDKKRRVVGCSHSGWRGTAGEMGRVTVEKMLAAIGPSICKNCYEVSADVAEVFRALFSREPYRFVSLPDILTEKEDGKFLLDLWRANEAILLAAGILPEHLFVTDLCTCCNPDYLFSHRASHGKRGNFCAFIMLNDPAPSENGAEREEKQGN